MATMTKTQMVSEIINELKWSDESKATAIKNAVKKNTYARISDIYIVFLTDKKNALYYSQLL